MKSRRGDAVISLLSPDGFGFCVGFVGAGFVVPVTTFLVVAPLGVTAFFGGCSFGCDCLFGGCYFGCDCLFGGCYCDCLFGGCWRRYCCSDKNGAKQNDKGDALPHHCTVIFGKLLSYTVNTSRIDTPIT